MKRHLTIFLTFLAINVVAKAQSVITYYSGSAFEQKTHTIKFKVLDSLSKQPIEFATAYLVPHGDTVITHFTVSSQNGDVSFANIVKGKYWVNVEILGYNSYKKEFAINSDNAVPKEILLYESKDFIDAATITGLADPIRQVKDTIIYNATAFKVGSNAMLEELLKTMPGIEVNNGKVTVNGKKVSEITVNGKTFFFGDMSVALKNLPAKIIDKIKVIDKENKESGEIGMRSSMTDKRVMDVELNPEFTKGVFGNVAIGGGIGWDNHLNEDKPTIKELYSGKVFSSIYGKKDQVTILADGNNEAISNGYGTKGGVNYSTSQVKGIDANISMVGSLGRKNSEDKTKTRYFQNSEMVLDKDNASKSESNNKKISTFLDVKNTKTEKIEFQIKPEISVSRRKYGDISNGFTNDYAIEDQTDGNDTDLTSKGWLSTDIKDIGRRGRNIMLFSKYNLQRNENYHDEILGMKSASSSTSNELHYDMNRKNFSNMTTLSYSEPIGKNWSIFVSEKFKFDMSSSNTAAKDFRTNLTREDLSSDSRIDNYSLTENLRVMYSKKMNIYAGTSLTHRKTYNSLWHTASGQRLKNDWKTNISPYLQIKSGRVQMLFDSFSTPVKGSEIFPAVIITSPTDVQTGNVFLRQPYSYELFTDYSYTVGNKYHISIMLISHLNTDEIVYANWFDANGIRNSFPVNARKPSADIRLDYSFWKYLDNQKHWIIHIYGIAQYNYQIGYQSTKTMSGLTEYSDFDYNTFIAGLYGNRSGSNFYDGTSGFRESKTNIFDEKCVIYCRYHTENLSLGLQLGLNHYNSRYSLVTKANKDVLKFYAVPSVTYDFPFGLSVYSEFAYEKYHGYGKGLDRNVYNWDMSFSKDFKMLSLTLSGKDLLNSSVKQTHSASSEYYQTMLSRILGRRVMLTLTYSFGKGNEHLKGVADRFARTSEIY